METRIALVTGASRGIGAKIAKRLAADGMYVIINYNGNKAAADDVLDEIKSLGGDGETIGFNVADYESVQAAVKDLIKRHGKVDCLVNNAGITRDNIVMAMSLEDFDAVADTNMKGCFYTCKALSRYFLKQKSGCIINISSYSGLHGNPGQVNYCAAKGAVIGMTKSLAKELASRNIRVNAVAPGFVKSDMTDKLSDEVKEKGREMIPLGRFGEAEEIAAAVSFLASACSDRNMGLFRSPPLDSP